MRIIGFKDGQAVYEDPGGVSMPNMPISRNTSGTYDKPTPSDVRFPDVSKTEFEGNVRVIPRDAAALREELGQPQRPGGVVIPEDLSIVNAPAGATFTGQWDYEEATSPTVSNGMFRLSSLPPILPGMELSAYLNNTDVNGLIYTWTTIIPRINDILILRNTDGSRIELLVETAEVATGYLIITGVVQVAIGVQSLETRAKRQDWYISLFREGPPPP